MLDLEQTPTADKMQQRTRPESEEARHNICTDRAQGHGTLLAAVSRALASCSPATRWVCAHRSSVCDTRRMSVPSDGNCV